MSFKILIFIVIVSAVSAIPIDIHGDAPAHYDFSYSVHDPHTGDIKSQSESRKGDAVSGRYELIDSDGHKRIVDYTADDHNGFNAVVHREPTSIKIPYAVTKVVAPVYHSAPAIHYVQPVHHVAKVITPVTHILPAHVSFKTPAINYHY
ncbi:larval cuticle protein A2B [Bradysia coprophila]|uniref:larval cuticle protein A2B n=1 Tax=Bradysia coprophila TaxID=38358 RepID=UPI00187D8613|nr:larval cuticle protein A2B [Bradysia coprophila]